MPQLTQLTHAQTAFKYSFLSLLCMWCHLCFILCKSPPAQTTQRLLVWSCKLHASFQNLVHQKLKSWWTVFVLIFFNLILILYCLFYFKSKQYYYNLCECVFEPVCSKAWQWTRVSDFWYFQKAGWKVAALVKQICYCMFSQCI